MASLQALAQEASDLSAAGKHREAAAKYDAILKLNDSIAEVHINKGVALSQAGEARGALGAFQRAGELKPTLSNAHSNAGNMLRELGEHREAAKAYRAALKLDPSQAPWWTSLCNSLNACDKSDEASVAATEGLAAIRPKHFAALHNERIFAFFKLGRPDEAVDDVEAILEATPFAKLSDAQRQLYAMILSQTGGRLLGRGEAKQALPLLERACEGDASADNLFPYGVALLQLGREEEGRDVLQRSADKDPDNWRVHVALGTALMRQQKFPDACKAFERALRHAEPKADPVVNFNYAVALMNAGGRDHEARAPLELVVAAEPDNHVALGLLGALLIASKDWKHAAEMLQRAAETKAGKDDATVHYNLGYARLMADQPEPALESFEESLRLDPKSEQAKLAVNALEPTAMARKERLTGKEIEEAVKAARAKNAANPKQEKDMVRAMESATNPLERAKAMLSAQRPPFLRRMSMEGIQLGYVVAMAGAYDEMTLANLHLGPAAKAKPGKTAK
jgi:tetratricopeptide (TPR) repeat protein